MLTFALLMSARMGIFQETLYKEYGKHSKEALFYNVSRLFYFFVEHTPKVKQLWGGSNISPPDVFSASLQHCLPLPGFLLLFTDIYSHSVLFSQSSESHLPCLFVFFLTSRLMLLCSSAPVVVPVLGLSVPVMWLYLLGNTITQYPVKLSFFTLQMLLSVLHSRMQLR